MFKAQNIKFNISEPIQFRQIGNNIKT